MTGHVRRNTHPAGITTADHPKCDPLATDGEVPIGDIALTEPDELALYTAPLTGYRVRRFNLEVEIMFLYLGAQDVVFRQEEEVIGQAGHAIPLQFPGGVDELTDCSPH